MTKSSDRSTTGLLSVLAGTTKQVFDECAQVYLREDKHWGCDLDIIVSCLERFRAPEVVELGTGYAWHLANLFFLSPVPIRSVVGVDYSPKMLERARELLSAVRFRGGTLGDRVKLVETDMTKTQLRSASFDVALILNNTLGNVPGHSFTHAALRRSAVLREARRLLRPQGFLVTSVYNARRFEEKDKYGKVFALDHVLSDTTNFDLVVRFKKTGTAYYSHWFTEIEVKQLVEQAGFSVLEIEERRKRLVVVAQKTAGRRRMT